MTFSTNGVNLTGKLIVSRKIKDLSGLVFGKLSVILRVDGTKRVKWKCKCDCGNEIEVYSANLTTGNTQSCGHCNELKQPPLKHANTLINLNDKFGWLTVMDNESDIDKGGYNVIWCECACGNPQPKFYRRSHLIKGRARSCGECHKYKWPLHPLVASVEDELDHLIEIAKSQKCDMVIDGRTKELLWQADWLPMRLEDLPDHYQLQMFDTILHVKSGGIGSVVEIQDGLVKFSTNVNGEFTTVDIHEVILIGREA